MDEMRILLRLVIENLLRNMKAYLPLFVLQAIPFLIQGQDYQCAARKTPAGCPATVALFQFMDKSLKSARAGSMNYDQNRGESLARAADNECNVKPECQKGAVDCGLMSASDYNRSKANNSFQQQNQQIIKDAQQMGQQMRNQISNIKTLKEGETIGFNEKVDEHKLDLKEKSLSSMEDWDNEGAGFNYPKDAEGKNEKLAQDITASIKRSFEEEEKEWEKSIAGIFDKFLQAFASGFSGIGNGLKDVIPGYEQPDEIAKNMSESRKVLKALSTLDDQQIQEALNKYKNNSTTFGQGAAYKALKEYLKIE